MTEDNLTQGSFSAEQADLLTNDQAPAPQECTQVPQAVGRWTPQDQARYGSAPLLPHESEERYVQIAKRLESGFGGYQSRFEHNLKKELVDAIWKRQRWEHAAAGSTNRLIRQLTEAGPSDFEAMLSELSLHQVPELHAPGRCSTYWRKLASRQRSGPLRW